jgi:hypothetical protein
MCIKVDLPAPFSPRSAWTSPDATEKSTPFRAWTAAKRLVMAVRVRSMG